MLSTDQVLTIMGAAEGSCYSAARNSKDVRYSPTFANAKSGLSYGVFQFDVASGNATAKQGMKDILIAGVLDKTVDTGTSHRIFLGASTRNATDLISDSDKRAIALLLSSRKGKALIDRMDAQRAASAGALVEAMIAGGQRTWVKRGAGGSDILTPGRPAYLRLFAYLLASWNRFEKNQQTFESWLNGEQVKTLNGPPDGFQLTAPPTIEQMHTFFKSLRIWDGTQGSYQNLRDRLDPTLVRMDP